MWCNTGQIAKRQSTLTDKGKKVSFYYAPIYQRQRAIRKLSLRCTKDVVLIPTDSTSLKQQGYGLTDYGFFLYAHTDTGLSHLYDQKGIVADQNHRPVNAAIRTQPMTVYPSLRIQTLIIVQISICDNQEQNVLWSNSLLPFNLFHGFLCIDTCFQFAEYFPQPLALDRRGREMERFGPRTHPTGDIHSLHECALPFSFSLSASPSVGVL